MFAGALNFFCGTNCRSEMGRNKIYNLKILQKKRSNFFCSAAGTTWRVWTVHRPVHEFRHRPSFRAPYTDRTDFPHYIRSKVTFLDEINVKEDGGEAHRRAEATPPIHAELKTMKAPIFKDVCSRTDPMKTPDGEQIEVPTLEDIQLAQANTADKPPAKSTLEEDSIRRVEGRIWIPSEIAPLVVAVTHGAHAHPGINATMELLKRHFWIAGVSSLVKAMNKFCLVCFGEHIPRTIKRTQGQQIFGSKRNAVLHLDFLYVRKRESKSGNGEVPSLDASLKMLNVLIVEEGVHYSSL